MSHRSLPTVIDGIKTLVITRPQTTRTVVMLHGFGASCDDLEPLAAHLDPQGAWNWVFPDGILDVPIGPHMTGRAWFPLRTAELEAAAGGGDPAAFAAKAPAGMKAAAQRLGELLSHLRVAPADLVLGGFSQGAMMAVQVAADLEADVRGLLLLSGALVNSDELRASLPRHAAVPFLQSHGTSDPMLAFGHAQRLHQCLHDCGLAGELLPFAGGHEIPFAVVERAARFLKLIYLAAS